MFWGELTDNSAKKEALAPKYGMLDTHLGSAGECVGTSAFFVQTGYLKIYQLPNRIYLARINFLSQIGRAHV